MIDEFWSAKSDESGNVRDGWSMTTWVEGLGIPKSPSPELAGFLKPSPSGHFSKASFELFPTGLEDVNDAQTRETIHLEAD